MHHLRYMNIIALDQTLVELKHGEYLNANWIQDEPNTVHYAPQKFIMAQAPTVDTISDFYSAIFLHKVSAVVCLTRLEESGRLKANRYWPTDKSDSFYVAYWKISLVEEKSFFGGSIVRRSIRMTRREPSVDPSDNELEFSMFHYMSWCDHGSPACLDSFAELLRLVRAVADRDRQRPVLAHCSAGVGRAGTFVASYNLILLAEMDCTPRVSVKEMVNWLRNQRYGAVQSLEQYLFIPRVVAHFEDQASSSSDSLCSSASSSSSDESMEVDDESDWLRQCQYGSGLCVK
jgi:protein tyrosine phosphatase